MKLIVTENYEELSYVAADKIAELAAAKRRATMILPTGNTPLGTYQELVSRQTHGLFLADQLRIFQMDEYRGLAEADPRSFYGWLSSTFLQPVGVRNSNIVRLQADATDVEAACRSYDQAIANAGGIDLCVLGIGTNGHLGFNEPPAAFDAPTRCVKLSESTLESNGAYWGGRDNVPRQAMTAGMTQLLGAKQCLLLVSGAHKREILRQVCLGQVTENVPASYLLLHGDATIIADRAAAEGI